MKRPYKIAAGIAAFAAVIAGLVLLYRRRQFLRIPDHELYVANLSNHSIVGFGLDSAGRATPSPSRVIVGPHTGLQNPFDVALDRDNRIWVLNLGLWPGQPDNRPTITVYDSDANGDAEPVSTFSQLVVSPESTLTLQRPGAIAIRHFIPQNILVADTGSASVIELLPDFSAFARSTGPELVSPAGIVADPVGLVFVAEPANNSILVFLFDRNDPFRTGPLSTIIGDNTLLDNPAHIALDSHQFLYVVNRGPFPSPPENVNITIYSPNAHDDAGPVRRIGHNGVPDTFLGNAYGIAVDQNGRIFVSSGSSVLQFSPHASGNVFLEQTIYRPDSLNYAVGLAVR